MEVKSIFLLLVYSAFATPTFDLVNTKPSAQMNFQVPEGFHFNLEAPSKVEAFLEKKWISSTALKIQQRSVTAKFDQVVDPCQLRAKLYICDDKNTFCLPEAKQFYCENGKTLSKSYENESQPSNAGAGAGSETFLTDPRTAFELSAKTNRPLLIDFYGIWCPPCNVMDATVFRSRDFTSLSSKFVLLKLDSDQKSSWDLKSKYKVGGYPTYIFANSQGEEIGRVVGSRSSNEFIKQMRLALSQKDFSFQKNKKLADSENSPKAAYSVGQIYLDRGEYHEAFFYLQKASLSWGINDIRRNKLLSAQIGLYANSENLEDKRRYLKWLQLALDQFPREPEALERASRLVKTAADLNDTECLRKAQYTQIKLAEWFLRNGLAKLIAQGWSRGDLLQYVAEAYETSDRSSAALRFYRQAAEAYLKDIKSLKLNETVERGYNLERAYCLWKAGDLEAAQALYESLSKRYSGEFTFYYAYARVLKDSKDFSKAQENAQKAFQFSYGDNKLRAAQLLAEIQVELQDKPAALKTVNDVLAQADIPKDPTIRTARYIKKLKELQEQLGK